MSGSVVDATEIEHGIVLVTMQDRINKNVFTNELIAGLYDSFKYIESNPELKVVILTGYDSYFASGGTKETLMVIQAGKSDFNYQLDGKFFYSLLLDCKIPVISAMQGHGIGAGFTFGLSADFVFLSLESYYTANYMNYGFTPGFGATCILPVKLGENLAKELLFNGDTYQGSDLKDRGIQFKVLPREEVLDNALELARHLAEKPRLSLITLKDHLNADIRERIPRMIQQELEMHEKTIHTPEVKEKIMKLYKAE